MDLTVIDVGLCFPEAESLVTGSKHLNIETKYDKSCENTEKEPLGDRKELQKQ